MENTANSTPLPAGKPVVKSYISHLAAACKRFEPVLVNEAGERWDGKPGQKEEDFKWNGAFSQVIPDGQVEITYDQFVNAARGAVMQVHEFIKEHEKLKKILLDTQKAFAEVEALVLGDSQADALRPFETLQNLAVITQGYRQMKDVLESAAGKAPTQAFKMVQDYVFPNGTAPTLGESGAPTGQN